MTGILALDICVALGLLAGGVAVLWQLARFLKRLGDVSDDWSGEPARDGVPGRPGVMARLSTIEAELHPNHGSSLRDAVDRLAVAMARLEDHFAGHLKEHKQKE
ncbi:hypothetical protein ACFV0L_29360 [Streptosporangium canum]|uniref:hypothetical protein n=1 Tax=Streptosporangium canum TaxID=324952 RepID=UPI0036915650